MTQKGMQMERAPGPVPGGVRARRRQTLCRVPLQGSGGGGVCAAQTLVRGHPAQPPHAGVAGTRVRPAHRLALGWLIQQGTLHLCSRIPNNTCIVAKSGFIGILLGTPL